MPLTFCTGNKNKLKEAQSKLGFELLQYDKGYPEVQADSLEDVVKYGMDHLDPIIEGAYFLDDSGLSILGLKDFPNVYSAYVFDTLGNDGILELLKAQEDRSALFRCVVGYRDNDGKRHIFVGECKGTISDSPKGDNGFGYDPVFIPDCQDRTFAQMTREEKNSYSHRGNAMLLLQYHIDLQTA